MMAFKGRVFRDKYSLVHIFSINLKEVVSIRKTCPGLIFAWTMKFHTFTSRGEVQ
jgi:hypothetical protein